MFSNFGPKSVGTRPWESQKRNLWKKCCPKMVSESSGVKFSVVFCLKKLVLQFWAQIHNKQAPKGPEMKRELSWDFFGRIIVPNFLSEGPVLGLRTLTWQFSEWKVGPPLGPPRALPESLNPYIKDTHLGERRRRKKKNAPTESGPLPDYTHRSWKIFVCEETPHSD